jgi:hypothetical protein
MIELTMCREYHCTPVELAKVPLSKILQHLEIMGVEAEIRQLKRKLKH